ncbi:MAG: hypothetical protein WBW81_10510 [Methylocella sp.]
MPAGSREGGQFQSGGAGGSFAEIPPEDRLTEPLRNAFAKLLARALAGAAFGPEGESRPALGGRAKALARGRHRGAI